MFNNGHGCRVIVLLLSTPLSLHALPPELKDQTRIINSRMMDVELTIQSGAAALKRAELWSTADRGQSWKLYQGQISRPSPIRFLVEDDGLYGLFAVLENDAGTSSGPPQPGQAPQQWVLVDTSPPLVQIRQVRVVDDDRTPPPTLVVSWTAYDANSDDRPISLYYQTREQPSWQSMASSVSNVGRFDWPIPRELSGLLQVKVEVRDVAGNVSSDISPAVVVRPQASLASTANSQSDSGKTQNKRVAQTRDTVKPPETIDPKSLAKAQGLFDLGVWHKERGDYGLAIERLVESLHYNPNMVTPAYELADIYYAEGKYQGAVDIYQSILTRQPQDRDSLRGGALAWVALRKYPEALSNLEQVLQASPNDAQTWLDAGDVFIWMGQREQARKYWEQAIKLSPRQSEIHENARRRLKKLLPKSKK